MTLRSLKKWFKQDSVILEFCYHLTKNVMHKINVKSHKYDDSSLDLKHIHIFMSKPYFNPLESHGVIVIT